jgi:hypothetical protein
LDFNVEANYLSRNGDLVHGNGNDSHGAIARKLLGGDSDGLEAGESNVAKYLQRDGAIRIVDDNDQCIGIQFDVDSSLTSTQWKVIGDIFRQSLGIGIHVDLSTYEPLGFVYSGKLNTVGELKRILRERKVVY